jgi:hypothetical protein
VEHNLLLELLTQAVEGAEVLVQQRVALMEVQELLFFQFQHHNTQAQQQELQQ